ncbi:response regulator transcription factor [Sediminitomix flava]|uniref:DNA-binding response OmpR family regulator n=1 Tax=Sediminitomix flava TaxID=379075 RepID=A0A315ZB43_SEDFL|nr:response regulator transcription factor [Sediminitomix flava]PWJ42038.1 DNA-binding response OmpR family regulator [Sediminitomix flava]
MYQILLAEDNESLGYILKEYLELHDFEVNWAKDGAEAFQEFSKRSFDLCILDVMMPQVDGFELAKQIRTENELVPIIFLTAKSLKVDKLKGYKIGADDYIVKPIDEDELLARINSLLRRASLYAKQASQPTPQTIHSHIFNIGKFKFDFKNQTLFSDTEKYTVTIKEAEVLKMLCENINNLLSREEALTTIWKENDYFSRRAMDVHISKLRKYLASDPSVKINNVHGKGFVLEVTD